MAAAAEGVGWACDRAPMADGGEGLLETLGGRPRWARVRGPLDEAIEAEYRMLTGATAVVEMARAAGLELAGVELVVACDVSTTFVDAADLFAPQKGASPAQVALLHRRLERLAQVYEDEHGVDVRDIPGSGAAGGLAGGLAAIGAELVPGFDLVAEATGLADRIERADLVATGEGFLDEQSLRGKVVGGVLELAEAAGVPALVVVGRVVEGMRPGLRVVSLVDRFGEERALADTLSCVEAVLRAELSGPDS